jgi:hypothetical protein
MLSSEMLQRVPLVRTDVSEERIASIIKRLGKLGTTLAATSSLQEPHGIASQKAELFLNFYCLTRHVKTILLGTFF